LRKVHTSAFSRWGEKPQDNAAPAICGLKARVKFRLHITEDTALSPLERIL
jgi:hypothetical protein